MIDDPSDDFVRKSDVESLIKAEAGRQLQDIVSAEVSKAEDNRFKQLKVFALIGLTGVFGICSYLVDKTLDSKMDQRVGHIASSLEVIRFHNMAAKLDYKKGIPTEDISEIMRFLRLKEKDTRVRNDKDFSPSLFNILHNFVSKDMTSEIDEIFAVYEKEILITPDLVETLLHHYGQAITVRTSAPTPSGDMLLDNFTKLERAGTKSCPHVSLYYKLLFTFKNSNNPIAKYRTDVNALIDECKLLDFEGKAWFIYNLLLRTRAANWQDTPNKIGKAIQPVMIALLNTFGGALETALEADPHFFSSYLNSLPPETKPEAKKLSEENANKDKAKEAVDMFLKAQVQRGKKLPPSLQEGYKPY